MIDPGTCDDNSVIEDFDTEDKDLCTVEEITRLFSSRYIEVRRKKITPFDVKCSGLLASNNTENIAVVFSDKSISVIDKETFQTCLTYSPHKKDVTSLSFSPLSTHNLYTSSLDGKVKIWDTRGNLCESTVNFNSPENKKPITAFDISPEERVICAGTELIGEDSFLLFWDVRGDKLLGGYWECHSDDISCIKFNPFKLNSLASAGLDGLLNVFDISQKSEDDALTYCLNTEENVNVINWCADDKKHNILAVTDVHSVQLWDVENSAPTCNFSRETVTKALRRNLMYECYVVPTNYSVVGKNPLIVAGSGLEHGSICPRTLTVNAKSRSLEPHGLFVTEDACGTPSVTQAAGYSESDDSFITINEDGYLSLWKNYGTDLSEPLKISSKHDRELKKKRPY